MITPNTNLSEYKYDPKNTDPVEADMVAMHVLEKLEEGNKIIQQETAKFELGVSNEAPPVDVAAVQTRMGELKKNLSGYQNYKKARGEEILSYEQEVVARRKALDEEKLANGMIDLHSADEAKFDSILKEKGDYDTFKRIEAFTPKVDGVPSARERYVTKKSMEMYGFSEREIDSGFAEPMFRKAIGAAEDEPTVNAISRWSLHKKNEIDRRHELGKLGSNLAVMDFLGMNELSVGSEKKLEEKLGELSDPERTAYRAMWNQTQKEMTEKHGAVVPLVKKLFNTIATEEGTPTKFREADKVGLFKDMGDALDEFSKLPEDQFPMVVASLAATAEAHGQDVDGYMTRVGKNFTRAVGRLGSGISINAGSELVQTAEQGLKSGKLTIPKSVTGDSPADIAQAWLLSEYNKTRNPEANLLTFSPERSLSKDEVLAVRDIVGGVKKRLKFQSALTNWKDSVAKVQTGKWYHPSQWGYTLASSVPEMAMAANPASTLILVEAKTGENLAEFQRANPKADMSIAREAATGAAIIYAAANRLQFNALFGKIPVVKNAWAKFTIRLGTEVVGEGVQDVSMPIVQDAYGNFDKAMPDVQLMGSDGKVMEAIKNFPKYAFAMLPMVALSSGGMKAVEYMDKRALNKLLKDEGYLRDANFTSEEIAQLKEMNLEEAVKFIEGRKFDLNQPSEIVTEIEELASSENATTRINIPNGVNVTVTPNEGGGFTVAGKKRSIQANTADEAVEAAMQLDPKGFAKINKEYEKLQQERKTQQETRPITPSELNNGQPIGFISGGLGFLGGENPLLVSEALPPNPNDSRTGQVSTLANIRFGLQRFIFAGRRIAGKSLNKIVVAQDAKAKAQAAYFQNIGRALHNRVETHLGKLPKAQRGVARTVLDGNVRAAMGGDAAAMALLPANVAEVVQNWRGSQDQVSEAMKPYVSKELFKKIKSNLGSYFRRDFLVFDKKSKWNYTTVQKHRPELINAARPVIMKQGGLTAEEADLVMKEMLDPARSESFYLGNTKVGKADITSFIQRQEIAPEILALMGEVTDPATIMRSSGIRSSQAVIRFQTQAMIADWLIANGLASRSPNPKLRHFEDNRVGAESVPVTITDKNTNEPVKIGVTRTKKAFAGFGELYVTPELLGVLNQYFDGRVGIGDSVVDMAMNATLRPLTAASKFLLVIANPAAFPTAWLGGGTIELLNGRVLSTDARGVKSTLKYFKSLIQRDGGTPFGLVQQREVDAMIAKDWNAKVGAAKMTWAQIRLELETAGILNTSVAARDLMDTVDRAWGVGNAPSKVAGGLGKAYQLGDNAGKANAFAYELDKWVRAKPDATMREVLDLAARDVRATTQNYDLVWKVLREFSQQGLFVPTFISYFSELTRTTANTAQMAAREIASGNPALMEAGFRRVGGIMATGALFYGIVYGLTNVFTGGLEDEDREKLKILHEPWLGDAPIAYLQADEDGLVYYDPSYLIQHAPFFHMADMALKGKGIESLDPLIEPFTDLNMMTKVAGELITGVTKDGRQIYNKERDQGMDRVQKQAAHVYKSLYKSGVQRTVEKWEKADDEHKEVGYAGTVVESQDIYLPLVGLRPYRKDTKAEKFLLDKINHQAHRLQEARKGLSQTKIKELDERVERGTDKKGEKEAMDKELSKLATAEDAIGGDVIKVIEAFEVLKIPKERVQVAVKDSNLSKAYKRRVYERLKNYTPRK